MVYNDIFFTISNMLKKFLYQNILYMKNFYIESYANFFCEVSPKFENSTATSRPKKFNKESKNLHMV